MDRERINIENRFDDLSECSEYYYDELGKLNSIRPGAGTLTKKEAKVLKRKIMYFLNTSLDNLQAKAKANDKVDKAEIKDFNKEFKKENKKRHLGGLKGLINKLASGRKCAQVEIEAPADTQLIADAQQGTHSSSLAIRQSTSVEVVAEQAEINEEE